MNKSSQAQAAASIRKELKKLFPLTKFSVTSESYSMGDSVWIKWNNGPTTQAIKKIVDKYQYGSFDGMTDCYNDDNKNADIPQTKYVHTKRTIDDSIYLACFEKAKLKYNALSNLKDIDQTDQELNRTYQAWTGREFVARILREQDLTNGLTM